MKSRMILFILGLAIWFVFTWPVDIQDFIIGIFVAMFVAFLTGDMFAENPKVYENPKKYLWIFVFMFTFLLEYVKASTEMIAKLIKPAVRMNPGIVKVKTSLKSETALAFLANAITLSRGTLTVDVSKEEGSLYIHWMDVKSQDIEAASKAIVEKFEKILGRIYE